IQKDPCSLKGRQQYIHRSRSMSKTNKIESEWSPDHYSNPTGRSLLLVHNQFKLPKENSKEKINKEDNKGKSQELFESGGITLSAPSPDLPMDKNNGKQSQQAAIYGQRFLESKPEKYYQPCFWCVNSSSRLGRQESIVSN